MSQWKARGKKRHAKPQAVKLDAATTAQPRGALRDEQGRVHLVLHAGRPGAPPHVTLRQPLFTETWQNDVAASTATLSYTALRAGANLERTVNLTREAMNATSRLAEGFLSRAANGSVACKAGCDHCCHQSVGVTTAEALTIWQTLRQTWSQPRLDAISERIAAARERTRGLSTEQRYSPEHPCPFLEAGQCSIYEVRPLSCRGMNSLDADECKAQLRDPETRAAFLASGAGGRSFLEPIRAFHAVSAGLQLGLSELFQLDMRPLDLTAAMHELLRQSEPLVAAWLAGESPLEGARGGDSSNRAQTRELSGTIVTNPNESSER